MLLVHGLLGYSFSWRFTIPALAQYATVYAPDMPGTGMSDRPARMDYDLHTCAARLLQFMDKTGVESCDLTGTSHGGAVAMMAAALAPQRFRRLVLVAPVNPWSGRGKRLAPILSSPAIAPAFLVFAPQAGILPELWLRRLYGDTRRMRPGTIEGYLKPLRRPGAYHYAMTILQTWNHDVDELTRALPRIAHIPTLLVWGSVDKAVYPSSAVRLKEQFRDCRLVMIEGVGHLPYEEVPDEFNRVVAEFLDNRKSQ